MALTFNGSSDRISATVAVASPATSAITMHAAFKIGAITQDADLAVLDRGTSGGGGAYVRLFVDNGAPFKARVSWRNDAFAGATLTGGTTISSSVYQSVQGWLDSASGAAIYYNGVADGSTASAPSGAWTSLGATHFGTLQDGGNIVRWFLGDYGQGAMWNVKLNDDEIAALGKGIHPTRIRPQSLVACVDCIGGRIIDWLGTGFVLTGTTNAADHPRVFMPFTAIYGVPAAGTPTATANLTGVEALGSAGTLATSNSVNTANLAGVAAPAAAGTLGKSISKALTGIEAPGAAGTVTAAEGAVTANLTGASATAAAGTIAATITVATVTLTGVSGIGAAGDLAASSADSLTGRRRRTRRRVRPFPDPAITAPESAPAYVPPLPGLPLLANYEPPGVTWAETQAALAQIETLRRAVELQRDVAVYAEIERSKAEFEALAARKKQQEDEDDEAATWLLIA